MTDRETLRPLFKATVLTLFPEMFPGCLGYSLAGRALSRQTAAEAGDADKDRKWSLEALDIRSFSDNRHACVDDGPFGGGAGMVLRPDVVDAAIRAAENSPGPLLMMSPRGQLLNQACVRELASGPGVRILCGRFEGIDQRVLDKHEVKEISIGDYVLSGGEPAALVLLDAIVRLLPGVVGNRDTLLCESHENGLLEYSHYTRPANWHTRQVPEVLLSGHHGRIETWRRIQAEKITQERRPDLWRLYQRKKNKGNKDESN